jgi:anti-sigma B factor antagonist
VATRIDGRRAVVEVAGGVDIYTAPELRAALKDAQARAERAQAVVVLEHLSFIDSTGLGLLVAAHKRAVVAGGRVALVQASGNLLRVLRITGLDRLMPSFDGLDAAFAWLDRSPDGPGR